MTNRRVAHRANGSAGVPPNPRSSGSRPLPVEQLAASTPSGRDRYVDFLRALATVTVVIGHWLAVTVTYRDGRLGGENTVSVVPWTHWLTWAFQVMGVFFLVGGYANASSWGSTRQRGGGYAEWVTSRAARLLLPTTVFVAAGVSIAALARTAGLDAETVRLGAWLVGISLWFLAVYLAVVALAPAMSAASRRWGLAVPAVLTLAAAAGDALRLGTGVGALGAANYLLVWLAAAALGFAWRDGTLTGTRARPWLFLLGGSGALVALTTFGPYPVSMVGVPGEPLQNTAPPTIALLALIAAQTGLVLLFANPVRRRLQGRRTWAAVIAVNGVLLTVFLWHMVPVLVLGTTLYPTGVLPQPPVGSGSWWAGRVVWIVGCAVLLAVLVAVFARFERPRGQPPGGVSPAVGPASRQLAAVLVVAGTAAACAGIFAFTVDGFQGAGPAGIPFVALVTYGGGLIAFEQARRVLRRSASDAGDAARPTASA